jgi:hypothetical protein
MTYRALWLANPSLGPQKYGQALQAWIFLSTAVNIIVTSLISIRLLRIRKQLSTVLSTQDLQIYLGIIAILVESALPLSLAGVAFAAVSTPSSSGAKTVARTTVLLCWFSLNVSCFRRLGESNTALVLTILFFLSDIGFESTVDHLPRLDGEIVGDKPNLWRSFDDDQGTDVNCDAVYKSYWCSYQPR